MSERTAAPDVRVELNQMALPDDFDVRELAVIAQCLGETGVRAEADTAPGSQPRDIAALTSIPFVLHFVTAHGADLAVGVASGAFWDAIKTVAKRLRRAENDHRTTTARIGIQYADGVVITVDLDDGSQIREALKELRAPAVNTDD